MENTKMELLTKENFGEMEVSFYKNENDDIFMTRNQIGMALGYTDPIRAMSKIHDRNKERLDAFSSVVNLTTVNGKLYNTTLYNEKGIYEIMRKSNQPKADEFYDFVYEVIEKVRKNGGYIHVEEGMTDEEIIDMTSEKTHCFSCGMIVSSNFALNCYSLVTKKSSSI